jgi:tetratricopeptide (TPR) repeat protein
MRTSKTDGVSEYRPMWRVATMPDPGTAVPSRLRRTRSIVVAFLAVAVLTQPNSPAQQIADEEAPVKWVIPKHADNELRDDSGNVITGTDEFELFQVVRKQGSRLQLRNARLWGWINADQVVSIDSAIEFFSSAVKDHPDDSYAYTARGVVWEMFRGDLDKAIADFTAAIRLSPRDAGGYNFRGYAFYLKREYDRAIADFNHAIRFDPREGLFFSNRGLVWMAKKDDENALADFTDAIRLAPQSSMAYHNRGRLRSDYKHDYVGALADYDHAIGLNPQDAQAHNNRAWLLATCPDAKHRDGKKAMESASMACELTNWKDPTVIDTLAAAQAESGDFYSATKSQSKAIELLSDEPRKSEYRTRLKLYQEKKPYHQPTPR